MKPSQTSTPKKSDDELFPPFSMDRVREMHNQIMLKANANRKTETGTRQQELSGRVDCFDSTPFRSGLTSELLRSGTTSLRSGQGLLRSSPNSLSFGSIPVRSDSTSVHSGPTPVHSSPTPVRSSPNPFRYGPIPDRYSPTPARHSPTQFRYGPTPAHYSPTPVRHRPTLAHCSSTPAHYSPTPARHSPTSAHYGPTPPRNGPIPTRYGPTPAHHGPTPTRYGPTPTRYGPTPARSGPTPVIGVFGDDPYRPLTPPPPYPGTPKMNRNPRPSREPDGTSDFQPTFFENAPTYMQEYNFNEEDGIYHLVAYETKYTDVPLAEVMIRRNAGFQPKPSQTGRGVPTASKDIPAEQAVPGAKNHAEGAKQIPKANVGFPRIPGLSRFNKDPPADPANSGKLRVTRIWTLSEQVEYFV